LSFIPGNAQLLPKNESTSYHTTGEKPEDLIASFRNAYYPRIAVSVDMISTGTGIKPLECLLFLRMIRSQGYFEQMKGRGTRVIQNTDLQKMTPDAGHKSYFVIVDAVGVCEVDKTDMRSLERKVHVPFEKLLSGVAMGIRDVDTLTSLAGRLARLERGSKPGDREQTNGSQAGFRPRTWCMPCWMRSTRTSYSNLPFRTQANPQKKW